MIKPKVFKYEIVKVKPISDLVKFKDHRRLKVFYSKGCTCVTCGLVGTKLGYGKDKSGGFHWDLYTDDFYPLTIDHIIPRSKGGSDELENLQPMCYKCNVTKGNGDNHNQTLKIIKTNKDRIKHLLRHNQTSFNIGDVVYNSITGKLIGVIRDFKVNEYHPRKELSVMIEGRNDESLYVLKHLGKLKPKINYIDDFKDNPIYHRGDLVLMTSN